MSEESQTGKTDSKPTLSTTPAGYDVINESFTQKSTSDAQTEMNSSSK